MKKSQNKTKKMSLAKASYLLERFMHMGLTPNAGVPPHVRQEWVAWGKRLDASPYCKKEAGE